MIKEHRSIEAIIDAKIISEKDAQILKYLEIRESFKKPLVSEDFDFSFNSRVLHREDLVDFLVGEKKFSKERLDKSLSVIQSFLETRK